MNSFRSRDHHVQFGKTIPLYHKFTKVARKKNSTKSGSSNPITFCYGSHVWGIISLHGPLLFIPFFIDHLPKSLQMRAQDTNYNPHTTFGL